MRTDQFRIMPTSSNAMGKFQFVWPTLKVTTGGKFHQKASKVLCVLMRHFSTFLRLSALRLLQNHAWGEKWCRKIWNSVSGVHFLRIFHVSSKIFFQVSEKLSYSMKKSIFTASWICQWQVILMNQLLLLP